MTIKQLAKELNVSPQAIYQRLQSKKIDVKTLTHPVTKELTSDGEFVVRSMYEQSNSKALTEKQSRQEDKIELEELRKQVAALIEKNTSLEKRVEEVIGERESFREAMLNSQRMQEQMLNKFLPAPQPEAKSQEPPPPVKRKLTWRERFSGKIG